MPPSAAARGDDRGARRARPLHRARERRRDDGGARAGREDRRAHAYGAARRPQRRADRAVPDRPVVRERQGAGRAGDRQRARRAHRHRPEELGEDLFRLDGEHPALVHLAPALVGPPHPGLVRPGRRRSSSRRRRRRREAAAYQHYGVRQKLDRDEDVLDTWFSSALWPFSTLGWPEETPELKRYYPTSVLVTGFDIIFFWVARMMMMGLHFMKEEPFHTRLHPRHRARREGRQDVEVEGERRRSPRADRRVRRRCAPLHHGVAGDARPRREAVAGAHRGLPQLRHQDLERRALLRDERMPARPGLRSRRARRRRSTAGS